MKILIIGAGKMGEAILKVWLRKSSQLKIKVTILEVDTKKANSAGWKPKYTIEKSIQNTVDYLLENKWILKKKKL